MAITSLLELTVNPESVAEARSIIDDVLVATRARHGCLGVDVLRDIDDEGHFMLVEKWATLDDDDAYREWRATPEGESALSTIVASRTLTRYADA